MTFKWQGKAYDTASMTGHETGNPAMPVLYRAPDGSVFIVEIDRVEGIEVRLAGADEAKVLAERHNLSQLLDAMNETSPPAGQFESAQTKSHALIVEDDGSSRQALGRLLHLSGYDISSAATISEANVKLAAKPRWLILDLNLPDGEGTVLLRRVRDEKLPIRVAITTATTDPDILSAVSRLSPDAIFRKPFDMSAVMQWLDAA